MPPKKAGEEAVDIRYTYDINGILEVELQPYLLVLNVGWL